MASFSIQGAPTPSEAALWADVCQATIDPAPAGARPDFEAARQRCEVRAAAAREYLTIYPGGRHRPDAVRILLLSLFEAGALSGGDFGRLRQRIAWYGAHGTPDERAEAAYWRGVLRDPVSAAPATSESGDREHAPTGRPVLRLREAFAQAQRELDRDSMKRIAALLERDHPRSFVTREAQATLARLDAVGKPFRIAFTDAAGQAHDSSAWVGGPVAIVVWVSRDAESRSLLREIDAFARDSRDLRLVGVNLDVLPADFDRARADLGIEWPQWFSGLGAAHPFAQAWGVERTPAVFVIGRDGRLRGAVTGDRWKPLLQAALQGGQRGGA